MAKVIRAAAELQSVCENEGWRFCFIGGLAVQRWGEPRETVDVDLDIVLGGLPFEETAVGRSSQFTFPLDVPLRKRRRFWITSTNGGLSWTPD